MQKKILLLLVITSSLNFYGGQTPHEQTDTQRQEQIDRYRKTLQRYPLVLLQFERGLKEFPHLDPQVIGEGVIDEYNEKQETKSLQLEQLAAKNPQLAKALAAAKKQNEAMQQGQTDIPEEIIPAHFELNPNSARETMLQTGDPVYKIICGIIYLTGYTTQSLWGQIVTHFNPTQIIDEIAAVTIQTAKNLFVNAAAGYALNGFDDLCQARFNERPLAWFATKSVHKFNIFTHMDYSDIKTQAKNTKDSHIQKYQNVLNQFKEENRDTIAIGELVAKGIAARDHQQRGLHVDLIKISKEYDTKNKDRNNYQRTSQKDTPPQAGGGASSGAPQTTKDNSSKTRVVDGVTITDVTESDGKRDSDID